MNCKWCGHEHPNGVPSAMVTAGHPFPYGAYIKGWKAKGLDGETYTIENESAVNRDALYNQAEALCLQVSQ